MIQIMSTFQHSIKLEMAITSLEQVGIKKENIFAVPLTNPNPPTRLLDSLHRSDGVSLFSTGAALGTALAVIGSSIGFILPWGPIYWGLIGAAGGFLAGFLIDQLLNRQYKRKIIKFNTKQPQVILIIECEHHEADRVEEILWHFMTLGTARVLVASE